MQLDPFRLPWPPSVNTVWRRVGKRTLLSAQARAYRKAVGDMVLEEQIPRHVLKGRLQVIALAHPPDARARDLDNLWKAMLDAIKHAGVIADDSHIDVLSIERMSPVPPEGFVTVMVREIA